MPKQRRFHEYRVEFSGVAEVPFTAFKNQVADNAEEAARLFKKELKAAPWMRWTRESPPADSRSRSFVLR
jgi:hypothetical protein